MSMSEQSGTPLTKTQAKERLAQVAKQAQAAQAERSATAEQRYEEAARPAWLLMHHGLRSPAEAHLEAIVLRCEAMADDAQASCDETVAIAEASRAVLFATPDPRPHWWVSLWKWLWPDIQFVSGSGAPNGTR